MLFATVKVIRDISHRVNFYELKLIVKNLFWVGPVYLVIFCYWVGPVPYLELFWAGPVKKVTLYQLP